MSNQFNIVILVALKSELEGVNLPYPTLFTGVGKVNAAYATMQAIKCYNPDIIINFGTAGAVAEGLAGLIECGAAVERDMDLTGLGLPMGQTFGDDENLTYIRWRQGPTIGTGDNFAQEKPRVDCDLVDMEAYAIARLCRLEGIQFQSVKYVSDKADEHAAKDWQAQKSKGAALFRNWLATQYKNP